MKMGRSLETTTAFGVFRRTARRRWAEVFLEGKGKTVGASAVMKSYPMAIGRGWRP